jgi:hypothetical protein
MQGPGGVGRHELDHDALALARACTAEGAALGEDARHDRAARGGCEPQVDEARARDRQRLDQRAHRRVAVGPFDQRLRDVARRAPLRLRAGQRNVRGEVAVRRLPRPFELDLDVGQRRHHGLRMRGQQLLELDLRVGHVGAAEVKRP